MSVRLMIKIFSRYKHKELENEVNDFIKDKDVVDFKFAEAVDEQELGILKHIVIVYKEVVTNEA